MRRGWRLAVLPVAVVVMTLGVNATAAQASPATDSSSQATCNFTLSAPSVTTASGEKVVTATLTPGACTGNITVNSWQVCVELKDAGVRSQCAFHPWWDPVTIYFAPYRPGGVYLATGRACGNVFPTFEQSCTSLGPYSATL